MGVIFRKNRSSKNWETNTRHGGLRRCRWKVTWCCWLWLCWQ